MAVDLKTQQALDIGSLPLPPGLRVLSLEAQDYTDWGGEPALRVSVVLDEDLDVERLPGGAIGDFKQAVRERLRKHGITLFPYFFFAKPSELAETDEE